MCVCGKQQHERLKTNYAEVAVGYESTGKQNKGSAHLSL